jgi:transcriptional regulator with XRE-family HTH domain
MPRAWVTSEAYAGIIDQLVAARSERGLTQRELANRLSKPPSFVAKIELGERRLDILEFIEFARALEVEPIDLFRRITQVNSP